MRHVDLRKLPVAARKARRGQMVGLRQRGLTQHVANRLHPRHFETVVEMFKVKLGFIELRRTDRSIWLRQPGTNIDLQFSRGDTPHRDADKPRSQVPFLSETPRAALADLAAWAQMRGLEASVGSYSEREFCLDASEACVLEAMTPDLADYGAKSQQ